MKISWCRQRSISISSPNSTTAGVIRKNPFWIIIPGLLSCYTSSSSFLSAFVIGQPVVPVSASFLYQGSCNNVNSFSFQASCTTTRSLTTAAAPFRTILSNQQESNSILSRHSKNMPRSSTRLASSSPQKGDEEIPSENKKPTASPSKSKVKGKSSPSAKAKTTAKKAGPNKRKVASKDSSDDDASSVSSAVKTSPKKKIKKVAAKSPAKTKTAAAKKKEAVTKATTKKATKVSSESDEESKSSAPKKAKKAKAVVQSLTQRDELPKLWDVDKTNGNNSYTLKIATWNVAGLRAIIKKDPQALATLVKKHDIDILCLQETKLQEVHLDDPKLKIRGHLLEAEGYDSYYSCSTTKKGYAGTAVFVKRRGAAAKKKDISSFFTKTKKGGEEEKSAAAHIDDKLLVPEKVSYGLGKEKHDGEGRVIVLDFPGFSMANLYVPNSGQKLERLDYRLKEWDKDLLAFMQERQSKRGVPVLWLGDLNVAHKSLDAYNFGAKHLDKQAGLTPEERVSFQEQLDAGFVDAFRELHPDKQGHYTYWSQRAGNRLPNKGLRLDYFVCDTSMFSSDSKVVARDSYMLPDQLGSDHGPAVLELEIKY